MTELEKVIRGLSICSRAHRSLGDCSECPYRLKPGHYAGLECWCRLCDDALALLKAQMPRVMTIDEVRECDDWMWVEYLSGYSEWNKQSDVFGWDDDGVMWNDATFDSNDTYDAEWRCWTSRPTPEQMASTPWEGGEEDGA